MTSINRRDKTVDRFLRSFIKESSPPPLHPKSPMYMAKKFITDFFISPDGDIYPTTPMNHWNTSLLIREKFYPKKELGESWESAETEGWISAHALASHDGYFLDPLKVKVRQRQIDTLFDLYVAYKKYGIGAIGLQRALNVFQEFGEDIGLKLAKVEKNSSKLPSTIKAKDMAQKKVYNFWMSPEGEIYPTHKFYHDRMYEQIANVLYTDPSKAWEDGTTLYDKGWVSGHNFDMADGELNFGMYSHHEKLTQKQLDSMFDAFLSFNKVWKNKRDGRAMNALGILKWELDKQGLTVKIGGELIASLVRINLSLDDYKRDLHDQIQDFIDGEISKQERLQRQSFDSKKMADEIEAIIGKTPETKALRNGTLRSGPVSDKISQDLLDAREKIDIDEWYVVFDASKKFHDYTDFLEGFDPDNITKSFNDSEESLLTDTTKIARVVAKEIESAIKRVKVSMKDAGFSSVIIKPSYWDTEFSSKYVNTSPVTTYFVKLGTQHSAPSFTYFAKENGKLEDLGDVLEGGDTDYFNTGEETRFYFDLVKELEHPGSTQRAGKVLTLYTARPIKDRKVYEHAKKVPVNIFLTSDHDRAAGIAQDLGASEVRDIWMVRINEQYLVKTLNTHHAKDYQTVGGKKDVPVKSIVLITEGTSKRGSFFNRDAKTEKVSVDKYGSMGKFGEDYRGSHSAPRNDGYASPLYDVTLNGTYPDDIYGVNGARYYGDGWPYDQKAFSIIQQARGKPNTRVKIYRAVPDMTKKVDNNLKKLRAIVYYHNKHGFFPMKNVTIYLLQDKYDVDQHGYKKQQELILKDLENQIEELEKEKKKPKKLTLTKGDWITTTLQYAKDHGRSNLNNEYKVVTKTVPAKHVFTDGNSIHEYGYDW